MVQTGSIHRGCAKRNVLLLGESDDISKATTFLLKSREGRDGEVYAPFGAMFKQQSEGIDLLLFESAFTSPESDRQHLHQAWNFKGANAIYVLCKKRYPGITNCHLTVCCAAIYHLAETVAIVSWLARNQKKLVSDEFLINPETLKELEEAESKVAEEMTLSGAYFTKLLLQAIQLHGTREYGLSEENPCPILLQMDHTENACSVFYRYGFEYMETSQIHQILKENGIMETICPWQWSDGYTKLSSMITKKKPLESPHQLYKYLGSRYTSCSDLKPRMKGICCSE